MENITGQVTETLDKKVQETPSTDKNITLTRDELNKLLNTESDRRVTSARSVWESKSKDEIENSVEERLKQVDAKSQAEKGHYKALQDLTREELAKKSEELDSLRSEIAHKNLTEKTVNMLIEKDLADLGKIFVSDFSSLEGREIIADNLTELINRKVTDEVSNRLKTKAPIQSNNTDPVEHGDLHSQYKAAEAKQDWVKVRQLGSQILDQNLNINHNTR